MHATLLFFAKVDSAEKDRLAGLMEAVRWEPLHVSVGSLDTFGRSALGVHLKLNETEAQRLGDRLVRSSLLGDAQTDFGKLLEEHDRYRQEPLGQLILALAKPEMERKRRAERNGRYPELHITLARCRDLAQPTAVPGPEIEFTLDRLALYESELTPSGSIYRIIAQAVT